jgi:hypothetical protein
MKRKKIATKKWSAKVTRNDNPSDLQEGVFKYTNPKKIAQSLKKSVENRDSGKADPFRSAMSRITFYVNRAGKNLAPAQVVRLDQAMNELRILFGKPKHAA